MKTSTAIIAIVIAAALGVAGLLILPEEERGVSSETAENGAAERRVAAEDTGDITIEELEWGCFGRDCIPSIDDPVFDSRRQADEWMRNDDLVFGVVHKGETRAYPQRILNWHEIVNDTIAGDPVAVTFCPLCGSALAFERVVARAPVEFGVSGRLYNSNLVMYDRSTEENLWQQATGKAIIGPAADRGEELARISIAPTTWENWKTQHPGTKVLSRNTGFQRDYDRYPYGTYEEDGRILFGVQNTDMRLPLKEVVYGFEIGAAHIAYTEAFLKERRAWEDEVAGKNVVVRFAEDGNIVMEDTQTGEEFVPLRTFWFAWAAFHPDTSLRQAE